MIEIVPDFYIGSQDDYEGCVRHQDNWVTVHACKEPYHRQALGYSGRGAPNTHPEYLFAKRENRLILNLVDVDDPRYIHQAIIDEALRYIHTSLEQGFKVLVHCNQGGSRAPGIGLLYLGCIGKIAHENFLEAEEVFRVLYPMYNPKNGIRGFLFTNWNQYLGSLL